MLLCVIKTMLLNHLRLLMEYYGEKAGIAVSRKHVGWYVRSLYEAKKKIEAHYTRPIVWRPADIMPSAIDQTPIIYAIVANDKIVRIDMSVFDLPDSSPEVLWQFVCKFYKINFWAYPKDILPSDDERGINGTGL